MAEETKKKKLPTAQKRMIKNKKANARNSAFKSSVRTAMRAFQEAAKTGEGIAEKLSSVFSLMDRGVKRGIYKKNTAGRTKSRLAAKVKS